MAIGWNILTFGKSCRKFQWQLHISKQQSPTTDHIIKAMVAHFRQKWWQKVDELFWHPVCVACRIAWVTFIVFYNRPVLVLSLCIRLYVAFIQSFLIYTNKLTQVCTQYFAFILCFYVTNWKKFQLPRKSQSAWMCCGLDCDFIRR